MELVVAGHLLGQRAAAVVLEHNEIADEREESLRRADALQHGLKLGHVRVGQRLPGDSAPWFEPLPPGGERSDAGLGPVRDHEHLVHGEQRRQVGFVGLELLPCGPDSGVVVGRVLQLDHAERQAVDEEHDIRPAIILVLGDSELVDRQPMVVGGTVKIDDVCLRAADGAALRPILHRHAIHQHPVEGPVAGFEGRSLRSGQSAERVVQRLGGEIGVEKCDGVAQPPFQNHLAVVGSLSSGRSRRDVRAVGNLPAEAGQPSQGGLFNVGFGDGDHINKLHLRC